MLTERAAPVGSELWSSWLRSSPRRTTGKRGEAARRLRGERLGDEGLEALRVHALQLRRDLALYGSYASMTVRCAALDRLHFGEDAVDIPVHLRPLLNRVLDLIARTDLAPDQVEDLEQLLFEPP